MMMGLWAGEWLHETPDQDFDQSGKRAVVKHLRFGPAETQIWYESKDRQYSQELHIIEGLQTGEKFVDAVSKSEMLKVIDAEIALCIERQEHQSAALFQAEREKIQSVDR